MEAVEDALARHGQPDTFITDQGNEFTSTDFIKVLAGREIKISLEGKGAWRDNLFVERLCRAIKYEEVYPCPCTASVIVPDPNAAMWATLQARMSGAQRRVLTMRAPFRPTHIWQVTEWLSRQLLRPLR
jgi:transposase InsO family protein